MCKLIWLYICLIVFLVLPPIIVLLNKQIMFGSSDVSYKGDKNGEQDIRLTEAPFQILYFFNIQYWESHYAFMPNIEYYINKRYPHVIIVEDDANSDLCQSKNDSVKDSYKSFKSYNGPMCFLIQNCSSESSNETKSFFSSTFRKLKVKLQIMESINYVDHNILLLHITPGRNIPSTKNNTIQEHLTTLKGPNIIQEKSVNLALEENSYHLNITPFSNTTLSIRLRHNNIEPNIIQLYFGISPYMLIKFVIPDNYYYFEVCYTCNNFIFNPIAIYGLVIIFLIYQINKTHCKRKLNRNNEHELNVPLI